MTHQPTAPAPRTEPDGPRPHSYVVLAYHQNATASTLGDPDYRPDDWTRPEYCEGTWSGRARYDLSVWLVDSSVLLAHAKHLTRDCDRTQGGRRLAQWLDLVLYGAGIYTLPRGERVAAQLAADQMARRDFAQMNFGALFDEVRESSVEPAPMA